MRARVIEIGNDIIYLEVDDQIRFTSRYCLSCQSERIDRNDTVDFAFTEGQGNRSVIIRQIFRTSSERPRLA